MANVKELQLDVVEEPPKSKKKFILVIAAVLVLVGGGIGATVLLLSGGDSVKEISADRETTKNERVEKESIAKAALVEKESIAKAALVDEITEEELVEEESVPKAPAIYIKLKPEFIINYQVGPRQRYLQVYMEAMTRDPAIADALEMHSPMMRSSIISLLSQQEFEYLRSAEGRAAVRQLVTEEVQRLVELETGIATGLEQILFTNYVMQ
jgi:flagellar FliL protein